MSQMVCHFKRHTSSPNQMIKLPSNMTHERSLIYLQYWQGDLLSVSFKTVTYDRYKNYSCACFLISNCNG